MAKNTERKKIVCVFPSLNIGGAEKALSFVANCCEQSGKDVHAIYLYDTPQSIQLNSGITKELISSRRKGNGFELAISKLCFLLKFRSRIKKIKPDLIIVFQSDNTKAVVYSTLGLDIPIIGSERNDPTKFNKKLVSRYRWAYNRCDAVVYQLQGAMDFFKAGRRQIVIPNPAVSRLNGEAIKHNTDKGNIVSAGRLCKQKNFELLINAYQDAIPSLGDRKLIIYGEGELKVSLQNLIKKNGLESRILLPGNVQDFTRIDDGGSIFVLSSIREGIPNALIEAMISGYACISTDCSPGGPAWLSDNGRRVCIVPMNDVKAMTQAMVKVANDEEYRSQLIANSKEIIELCNPERIGKMWIDLINEVMNERKRI